MGAQGHGRTLTCLDRAGQPAAAISFHLERGDDVLLVTALAVLTDGVTEAERAMSEVLAGVLLCYLARAAVARGLPARLGFDLKPEQLPLAQRLGAQAAAPPAAYQSIGDRYRTWTPPLRIQAHP